MYVFASLPDGLPDRHRLIYTVECLFRPFGLLFSWLDNKSIHDQIQLSWAHQTPSQPVELKLEKVREAFDWISGRLELMMPKNGLRRVNETKLDRDYCRPWFSEWAWELAEALARLNPSWQLPSRNLTVYLTHDVDRVNPLDPVGLLRRLIVSTRGIPQNITSRIGDLFRWIRNSHQFLYAFRSIMQMEHETGAIATYFLMSGPYSFRKTGSRTGNCLMNKRLAKLVKLADQYGHRIGLHGCAYSLEQLDYRRQREALSRATGHEITWHRNHYLVWDPEVSPRVLKEAGLRVDSTLGFNTTQAFRTGLAWAHELWDLEADAPSGMIEIPMVFMDAAGIIIQQGSTWDGLYAQLERSSAVGGEVAINFHLEYFVGHPHVTHGYKGLLDWLRSRGANLSGDILKQPVSEPGS